MDVLSAEELGSYWENGFLGPIRVISPEYALQCREELPGFSFNRQEWFGNVDPYKEYLKIHLLQPSYGAIVTDKRLVALAQQVLGVENIVCFNSNVFHKSANSRQHITPHQDGYYWKLKSTDNSPLFVAMWIALGDVPEESGPMRFYARSHKKGVVRHVIGDDDPDNMLSRSQKVMDQYLDGDVCSFPLLAGEASIHHPNTIHESGINKSEQDRIGLVIRYTSAMTQPVDARGQARQACASLVAGSNPGFWTEELVSTADLSFSADAVEQYRQSREIDLF